ncbi:acetyl-CoA hydrolase/transferase family protein [Clostridium kluyveri]|uniref:4-hydroxybutyrate CoA-transferase n=1 Tax=Clostridium kluyveri TaxID=1534 RepID=A0A1L5FD42_CLOKL|nr:acetyl-CoA hydrolase/transferase C-terminal domain-containing protein [Clostridium kluyveri]APM40939.1 4-hydroxybutyrate CoA-transferase [Clostridium kluyveri]UZQ48784.1 acetyl-CoA hydrolase/transferase family protein [Clostridium kluyveri]
MVFKNWQDLYKSKVVSADEAVSKVSCGDSIILGNACGASLTLLDALAANKEKYKSVKIHNLILNYKNDIYTDPESEKYIHGNTFFVSGGTKEAVNCNRTDYTPCFFYEIPKLLKQKYINADVAFIHVSKPDSHGYCSFGVSTDYSQAMVQSAKLIIAEVNDQMPRVLGDNFIHISDMDYIVESSRPILELTPPKIGEVEKTIGKYCASLVEDGSTLQLGIGAIPDAVLLFLKDKKDLGIHSEMISDGVVELVEAGVITNKKKSIHPGKIIITFLMGTKKLYDFINDNPMVEGYPVDYVNDPKVIMQNSKMVCINSCVEVDFTGQVCAESVGFKQISGVGGQVDYMRGASMADGGKSILAIPSTAAGGKISRIVPILTEGAGVTTSRYDVQYVVTEYGIALLKGKSIRERAKELIKIAHPKFREELTAQFEQRFSCKL